MINFAEVVAREKLKQPLQWQVFAWKSVEYTDDLIVTGGVPRLMKSGKRKGERTWSDSKKLVAVVTKREVDEAKERYEKETKLCHRCCGEKKIIVKWDHVEGNEYETCGRCHGSGHSPLHKK